MPRAVYTLIKVYGTAFRSGDRVLHSTARAGVAVGTAYHKCPQRFRGGEDTLNQRF